MKKLIFVLVASLSVAATVIYLIKTTFNDKEITISIVGDIMLSRGTAEYMEEYGCDYPYEYVRDIFLSDDLTIGNLECILTDSYNFANKPLSLLFKADIKNAVAMKEAGIDCLNLANNHTLDYNEDGVLNTIDIFDKNKLGYFGAGKNEDDIKPYIFKKNGIKVGFLAYNEFADDDLYSNTQESLVKYISSDDMSSMKEDISAMDCDFIVVYFHWGIEYVDYITKSQEMMAKAAIDYGADLVIGTHPHVLQKATMYNGKYIFYSLGNFIFDRQIQKGTDESIILQVNIKKGNIVKYDIIPVVIKNCRPMIPDEEHKERIFKSLGIIR